MLNVFVKSLDSDISKEIYTKQVSEKIVDKMINGMNGYNSIKLDIIKNNGKQNYKGNLCYDKVLKKNEDNEFDIVYIEKRVENVDDIFGVKVTNKRSKKLKRK
jgi:hypothetical protein